jgi:hypothetical protein
MDLKTYHSICFTEAFNALPREEQDAIEDSVEWTDEEVAAYEDFAEANYHQKFGTTGVN